LIEFNFEDAPAVERRKETFKKKEKKAVVTPSLESASASVPAPTVLDPAPTAPAPTAPAPTAPAPTPPSAPSAPIPAIIDVPAPESALQEKVQKKEKKKDSREEGEKKNKGGKAEETGGEPVPSMIDLRVGRIVDGGYIIPVNGMFADFIASCQTSGRRRALHRGMRTLTDIVSADI